MKIWKLVLMSAVCAPVLFTSAACGDDVSADLKNVDSTCKRIEAACEAAAEPFTYGECASFLLSRFDGFDDVSDECGVAARVYLTCVVDGYAALECNFSDPAPTEDHIAAEQCSNDVVVDFHRECGGQQRIH